MTPNVFIATPTYEMRVSADYLVAFSGTQTMLGAKYKRYERDGHPGIDEMGRPVYHRMQDDIGCYARYHSGAEPCRARNGLVAEFLAQPQFTHICFIDPDQGWTKDTIPKLLSHNVHVIGVPILKKIDEEWTAACDVHGSPMKDGEGHPLFYAKKEPQWNFFSEETPYWDGRKLQLIGPRSYVGTGIMLISRECLVGMIDHYKELQITVPGQGEGGENCVKPYFAALFQRTVMNGEYGGEDITFCRRWLAMGGEVYMDPTIQTTHIGQRAWTGRFADVMTFGEDEVAQSELAKPELVGAVA